MKGRFVGLHWDFLGFSASVLCAIHCVALPVLLSVAPLTGKMFLDNNWVEDLFILVSIGLASYALIHGYRGHHQRPVALLVMAGGFSIFALGHFGVESAYEVIFTTAGGLMVASAHWINWMHIRESRDNS